MLKPVVDTRIVIMCFLRRGYPVGGVENKARASHHFHADKVFQIEKWLLCFGR